MPVIRDGNHHGIDIAPAQQVLVFLIDFYIGLAAVFRIIIVNPFFKPLTFNSIYITAGKHLHPFDGQKAA